MSSMQLGLVITQSRAHRIPHEFSLLRVLLFSVFLLATFAATERCPASVSAKWQQDVSMLRWIAYSPSTGNPNKQIEPTNGELKADLALLRQAGFNGLVTYSSTGMIGKELPAIATSLGFRGLIIGVWDPTNQDEIAAAKACSRSALVAGYCVGNEGLGPRYKKEALLAAIQDLRTTTRKPVTTTEEIDDYSDESLIQLGDWVFPNAHPYFHSKLEPESAIRWTQGAYEDLRKKSGRFVLFKEVGLPTQGDDKQQLSEAAQAQYYVGLARTPVRFVYFEAFDQPWKTHLPIEPYWGIFRADRQPKRLGSHLLGSEHSQKSANVSKSTKKADFYIYRDADSPQNHFKPTGYMGDAGDIHIDEACETRPASGKTCIRVVYDAKGRGPNICSYTGPCKWAAAYWQHPPNNWGKDEADKAKGFDLSGHKYLRFAARSDKECRIEFKVGGLDARFGDSLTYPRSKLAKLNGDWQEFQIDLDGANLTYIIGGFCWASNWESNPSGATFYLDDIRFVR